jgi:hypothetical protein
MLFSYILLGKGLSIIFKSFVDLVGEGYSLRETLLVGPWFSWYVLIGQETTILVALVSF